VDQGLTANPGMEHGNSKINWNKKLGLTCSIFLGVDHRPKLQQHVFLDVLDWNIFLHLQ
jgi:hypothetical protein